jgi:hypothetical protein
VQATRPVRNHRGVIVPNGPGITHLPPTDAEGTPNASCAGGPAAIARIQRLLAPPATPGLPVRAVRLAAGLAALMIPVVITSVPLAIAACDIMTRA